MKLAAGSVVPGTPKRLGPTEATATAWRRRRSQQLGGAEASRARSPSPRRAVESRAWRSIPSARSRP
jgi:hypothetical protein